MFGEADFFSAWGNFILSILILLFAVWVLSTFLKSKVGEWVVSTIKPLIGWYYDLSFGIQKFLRVIFYFVYIAACFMLIVYVSS